MMEVWWPARYKSNRLFAELICSVGMSGAAMETRLLRSFLAVAELGSLTRAAERLHITQPALSRQIQQLESELGAEVFRRTGRGVELTAAGQELEVRARPLVLSLERLADDVLSSAEELRGSVRLAFPPSTGTGEAADILQTYQARHPRVALRVAFALTGSIESGLIRGDLDVGVLFGEPQNRVLRSEPLWEESLSLVGPPDAELDANRPVTLRAALERPMLLPAPRHGLRAIIQRYAVSIGGEVRVVTEIDSLQLLLEMLRRGAGYAILPARVARDAGAPALRIAPIVEPVLSRTTSVCYAADRHPSRATEAMVALLKERFGA